MDTIEAIKKRRSIRSYTSQPVSKEIIEELLTLANLAPSACNTQNRTFVVAQEKEQIRKLNEAALKQDFLLEAPVIIAFALDKKALRPKKFLKGSQAWGTDLWGATEKDYQNNEKFSTNWRRWSTLWPIQDVDCTIMTFMLAATDKGLGTCFIGLFDADKVKEILEIPDYFEVIALVTLGYENKPPHRQSRKPLKKLLHWEKWS